MKVIALDPSSIKGTKAAIFQVVVVIDATPQDPALGQALSYPHFIISRALNPRLTCQAYSATKWQKTSQCNGSRLPQCHTIAYSIGKIGELKQIANDGDKNKCK